ncbi:MAG: sigma-70 family RNA polymerase sigma factor [Holosporales bacterium]|jgi:RNA polymerase sigma-32 factor|nr:sigma-70 family RNA polymerase sigma factor [Holosporales bacterium]
MRKTQYTEFASKEEEFSAFRKMKEGKDPSTRDLIILNYAKLVRNLASKYCRLYGLDLDELISEGTLGLIKALELFDVERGFRFATYATFWVKAYLKQYIDCCGSIVKRTRQTLKIMKEYNKACLACWNSFNSAFFSDISIDKSFESEDSEGGNFLDFLQDEQANFEEKTIEEDLVQKRQNKFKNAFEKLKAREQEVIERRYFSSSPETLECIAQNFNMTVEGVRQLEKRTIEKIKKEIQKQPSPPAF